MVPLNPLSDHLCGRIIFLRFKGVLIPIIPLCFPAVGMRKSFFKKPQLKIIGFQSLKLRF